MANADNSVENLAVLDLVIPKNGYIYIYVANESPTDVYFDNLQIIHKKSNVLELSDYYPYGLRNEALSYSGLSFDPANAYQYQNKELQTALNLNMHEFGLRHYDATLGRWGVQDPYMQFFNPYLAMGNNTVNMIDPDGGQSFVSYSTSGESKPSAGGGDDFGWRGQLARWASMNPDDQKKFQNDHGTATQVNTGMGSPTMHVGVHVKDLRDGTTVVQSNNGDYLWSSNNSTHPVENGKLGKLVQRNEAYSVPSLWSSSGNEFVTNTGFHFEADANTGGTSSGFNQENVDFAGAAAGGLTTVFGAAAHYSDMVKAVGKIGVAGNIISAGAYIHAYTTNQVKPSHHLDAAITGGILTLSAIPLTAPFGITAGFIYGGTRLIGGEAFDNWFNSQFTTPTLNPNIKK